MKKIILCLIMAIFMMINAPLAVNAAESKEWTVNYDGNAMTTLIDGQIAENPSLPLGTILPGESFELKATIKNTSSNKTDWYMSNEIVKALEDSNNSATGSSYIYLLTYHESEEAEPVVIYNSSSVGAQNPLNGERGLKEINESLAKSDDAETRFYLDRLEPNEEATICLYVKFSGEAHHNAYQNTMAELKFDFAVEKILEGTITKEISKVKNETVLQYIPTQVVVSKNVNTGDNSQLWLFSSLAFISAVALIGISAKKIIKRRNGKGELQ